MTPAERTQFATELVTACRTLGLRGIALTDHHEMVMFPYVRRAAELEVGSVGVSIPPAERLVVFPGMELTLGVPCQALLIFDPDFPEESFPFVYGALGLNPAPDTSATGASVGRISRITKLSQLYEELEKNSVLRGRFIVIPNVSEGGQSTLLRSGHSGHYREMPCVGGYIDGSVGQLGLGNQNILEGRDSAYGNRALGLFQTSDCRSRDFGTLGAHRTWVKWAEPSAEALRQACLARESRISQALPQLPGAFVTALSVSNCRFLGPQHLELNAQYNALIGGRGTGKSTLLEYLRWGLCDDAGPGRNGDSPPEYGENRRKLISDTLQAFGATVTATFSLNGVAHVVRRNSADGTVALKIGAGEFSPASAEQVRGLLPIQAYSQKQLSQVSVRLDELRRFLEAPIRDDLGALRVQRDAVAGRLREGRARVIRHRQLRRRIGTVETELQSVASQIERLRGSLGGLSEADRAIIGAQAGHEQSDRVVSAWRAELQNITGAVDELRRVLAGWKTVSSSALVGSPQAAVLEEIRGAVESSIERLRGIQAQAVRELGAFGQPETPEGALFLRYEIARKEFRERYEEAKQRSTAHQQTLQELATLEGRGAELQEQMRGLRSEGASLATAEDEYRRGREEWGGVGRERSQLLEGQCGELTSLSSGSIRAKLRRGAGSDVFIEKARALVAGSGARAERFERLRDQIRDGANPSALADDVVRDFEAVLESRDAGSAELPSTPRLSAIGFTQAELLRARERMGEDTWLDLALADLEDVPEFEYRVREAEYIPFASASAGQQATALLWTLLNQTGPPLVIDQPEDDLDNQVMPEVARALWGAKKRRQLVFASHNANLVVNGDAELVVCCGNRVAGEQSSGTIVAEGAIDVCKVREEIARVMEGGKEAFDLRRAKYGF